MITFRFILHQPMVLFAQSHLHCFTELHGLTEAKFRFASSVRQTESQIRSQLQPSLSRKKNCGRSVSFGDCSRFLQQPNRSLRCGYRSSQLYRTP